MTPHLHVPHSDTTTFVVDTSTLIYDPHVFFAYGDSSFIIPNTVIRELDKIKEQSSYRGAQAREVFRTLDSLRKEQDTNFTDGVETDQGGTIRVELNHVDISNSDLYPDNLHIDTNDDTIIVVTRNLCLEKLLTYCDINTINRTHIFSYTTHDENGNVRREETPFPTKRDLLTCINTYIPHMGITLLTQDVSMSILAEVLAVPTARHHVSDTEFHLPCGIVTIDTTTDCRNMVSCYDHADENIISDLYRDGKVQYGEYYHDYGIQEHPVNTGIVLKSGSESVLCVTDGQGTLYRVATDHDFGVLHPKGVEQQVACALMSGNERRSYTTHGINSRGNEFLCSLSGCAGSGKTTIALLNGLYGVKNGDYDKIIVFRPTVNMSKNSDLGFLPGNLDEKMEPWVQAVKDVLKGMGITYGGKDSGDKNRFNNISTVYRDVDVDEVISVEPVNYLRGRTFKNTFVIVDEAQNMEPHELMTIITRLGYGSSLVMTWDNDQVDNMFVNNTVAEAPLSALERVMPDPRVFHINLPRNERGGISGLFAQ